MVENQRGHAHRTCAQRCHRQIFTVSREKNTRLRVYEITRALVWWVYGGAAISIAIVTSLSCSCRYSGLQIFREFFFGYIAGPEICIRFTQPPG